MRGSAMLEAKWPRATCTLRRAALLLCRRDAHDDGGDVVGAARLVGAGDELLRALVGTVLLDDGAEFVVLSISERPSVQRMTVSPSCTGSLKRSTSTSGLTERAIDLVALLVGARLSRA